MSSLREKQANMGNNEQSYERVRAQLRAFDLRLTRIEQRVGISSDGAAARVPRVSVQQGRGTGVQVRRLPPAAVAAPAAAAAPLQPQDVLNLVSDAVRGLSQLGGELARAFQPQQQPAEAAEAAAPPGDAPGEPLPPVPGDDLSWLGEETGEQPPPVVESSNPNG